MITSLRLEILIEQARQKMKELAEVIRKIEKERWEIKNKIAELDKIGNN